MDDDVSDISGEALPGGRISARGVIGAWEPDELYRAEAHMKRLEHDPGFKLLMQLLATEHKGVIHKLTGGAAKPLDHAQYAFEGGRANGLQAAAAIGATIKGAARAVRQKLDEASPDDGETTG